LPFGLLFLALTWWNRKKGDDKASRAPSDGQRLVLAGALALTLTLFALEAETLRRIEWAPRGASAAALPVDRTCPLPPDTACE